MTILHQKKREENLDTQSLDISAEVIREPGRSFQSLIVIGKKLCLQVFVLAKSDTFNIQHLYWSVMFLGKSL